MNEGRRFKKGFLAVSLLMGLLLLINLIPNGGSEWSTTVFEEAVNIDREPDHINDRAPFNMEPVRITITSKTSQTINAAEVRMTWSHEGITSPEGGNSFTRINQTAMEVEIQGYKGGYTIQYRIIAYDEVNHPLTSTTYSYTVLENGSWQDTDFENNIILDWEPKQPEKGENVTINITSRDPFVAIAKADLLFTMNIPNYDPLSGVDYFRRINSTAMTYDLISYPEGSRITFYVDAYDQYDKKITSNNQVYEYERAPPLDTIYRGKIYIILEDDTEKRAADGATVTFSNETFSFETRSSVAGIASTDQEVNGGAYRVEVTYNGKRSVFNVEVPNDDGKFTFDFKVNRQTYKVSTETEERPYLFELFGLLIIIALTVLSFHGAVKIGFLRETMNEKKRKARKKEENTKETLFEKILKDEELKNRIVRSGAILLLSLLGLFWAPFFPWWMVIILAAFLTGVAWRFPYISMLVMAVLVTAAASYQSTEMGWVFLLFSLVVMIGGFFDWKYAYLSFLTIFAAGFGLGFAVPIIAAVAFSLFMGTVVWISASLFLLVIAPSGTFQLFSLIASPSHDRSFVQFQRGVDPNWSPVDVANMLGDLTYVDTDMISTVLQNTMGSLVPMFGLIGWGLAMVAGYWVFRHLLSEDAGFKRDPKIIGKMLIPAGVLLLFGVISIIWADVDITMWLVLGLLSVIPASLIPFGIRRIGEEGLPLEYGVEEMVSADVGKKISEMVGFRKASFNDIGGLEDVKREIKNALMLPLLEPEMAKKYGVKPSKGIMMFGPPGCGKTLMLRAVASDLNVDMIGIKCSDVMSKWYGESENLVSGLFEEARARSPCILFLDEIDAIAKRRDFYSTDDVTPRVLSIMLSEMDGMDDAEGIIIVATTNMPDLVDPALMRPGRFDKVMYIPPPDRVSREEILKVHLKGKYASDVIDVKKLALRSKGFSGADLANLVREASSLGLERALETKKPQPMTMGDLEEILDEIKPSITSKMIKAYDKLRREYERKRKKGTKKARARETPDDMEEAGSTVPRKAPSKKIAQNEKKEKIVDLDTIEHDLDDLHEWEES
ncbi:MAG: AAA family ATPase [Candidatus Thermoplasmatota archaeon]|nr:AAA family ATPase [Candidatus Thermoplasmatota archaeon]